MKQSSTRVGRVNLNPKLPAHAGGAHLVIRAKELTSRLKQFGVKVSGNIKISIQVSKAP